MNAKAQREREAVYHIQSMYRGLAMVGPLQDLCKEYKEAKAHSWKVAGVKGRPVVRPTAQTLASFTAVSQHKPLLALLLYLSFSRLAAG